MSALAKTPVRASTRLPLLDALRTVAAIGVMLYHVADAFGPSRLFARTYLFVDLFFLLSGFVLTLAAEPSMAGRPALAFVRARLRRLWPLVALGTLAGALAFLPGGSAGQIGRLTLLGLMMLPQLQQGFAIFPLNGPQWSLLWELAVNALHAAVLHRLSERQLLGIVGLAGIALVIAIFVVGGCTMGPNAEYWWLAAPRVLWAYGLGIWFARKWRQRGPVPLADWRVALFAPLAALLVLPWLPLGQASGDAVAVLVVLPALFWVAANAVPPAAVGPILQRIGAISFPLYALHEPVLVAASFISERPEAKLIAAGLALLLAASAARYAPFLGPAPQPGRPRQVLPAGAA